MRRAAFPVALTLALVFVSLVSTLAAAQTPEVAPANEHFQRTWARTDQPILAGQTVRTWMWGIEANTTALQEPYAQAPGGMRTVQYFDKSRMEINHDPNIGPDSIWYVTNGLLVVELITGRLKTGDFDHEYEQYPASTVNVAGDADDANGPTYATFANVLNVSADSAVPAITQVINRQGVVSNNPAMAAYGIPTVQYVDTTDHWIAEPFWQFMTASGVVFQDGAYITAPLFENPYYATGLPITDPFWARVKVAGVVQDVLVQCFERRCLTYTPGNDPAWRVEMGNVGLHYHHWRYVEIPSLVEECPDTDPGVYVWVADTVNDRIQKFTAAGEHVCSLVTGNAGPVDIEDPWAIAVDPANNDLWVHTDGWLHRFDYRGNWEISFGDGDLLYEDIAIDGDGNVYGVNALTARIEKHSPAGDLLMEWGVFGDNAGDLNTPTGIELDADGNIYVVDSVLQRVTVFNAAGSYQYMFGSDETLIFPSAIELGANGNVYVADHSIVVFDENGAHIDTWESTDDWTATNGMTIAANGNLYAIDRINSSINYFNLDGNRLGGWGEYGSQPGNFDTANDISASTR